MAFLATGWATTAVAATCSSISTTSSEQRDALAFTLALLDTNFLFIA
jgi:hypothetical protein